MNKKTFMAAIAVFALLFSLAALIQVRDANAQQYHSTTPPFSLPTPSIPEFTLSYSDKIYTIPPTTYSTTNPYTGNTTTTLIPSQFVENKTINITINNQQFPSTLNGYTINLYYDVQTKPHFGDSWTSIYGRNSIIVNSTGYETNNSYSGYELESDFMLPSQSNSETTLLSASASAYQSGYEIDFRVQAFLAYRYDGQYYQGGITLPQFTPATFVAYQTSGWSNLQTITIPQPSPTLNPVPTPTPSPSVAEFPNWTIIPLAAVFAIMLFCFKKRKRS